MLDGVPLWVKSGRDADERERPLSARADHPSPRSVLAQPCAVRIPLRRCEFSIAFARNITEGETLPG